MMTKIRCRRYRRERLVKRMDGKMPFSNGARRLATGGGAGLCRQKSRRAAAAIVYGDNRRSEA